MSLLFAAPVRFSKFEKATPPTVPLPGPVTLHVESAAGPLRVSVPAPPSKTIAMPAEASEESIVNESSPSPPVTVRAETDEIACDCDAPSIVTEISVPETAAEIVCDEPSVAVTFHGAGGARPLAVHVVGSGVDASAPVEPDVAPSDCVEGVEPTPVADEEPDDAPLPADVPAAHCPSWSEPVTLESSEVVVVPVTVLVSTGSVGAVVVRSSAPTVPESPVVSVAVVVVVTVPVIVPVSDEPTVAVVDGGGVWSESDEMVDGVASVSELVVVVVVVSLVVPAASVSDAAGGCVESVPPVVSSETEKNSYVTPLVVAGVAGTGVAGAGVPLVDVEACAGCAGGVVVSSAVAGSVASAPTSSSTTGAFAYGSAGAVLAFGCGEAIVCESETTGTTCRFTFVVCALAVCDDEAVVAGAIGGSAGSG